MNQQERFWTGAGGTAYTHRNRVEWNLRVPFWQLMIDNRLGWLKPDGRVDRSILEVGCGSGWNLRALEVAAPGARVSGVDINPDAIQEAREAKLHVHGCRATDIVTQFGRGSFDLVFTAGVLIHQSGEQLLDVMQKIARVARHYVLAIEYESHDVEEIPYRGKRDLLWKRPYGELYRQLGLTLVDTGDAGVGFDRCTFWLMEK